jgi:putative hydrolase of the HAD superfamily
MQPDVQLTAKPIRAVLFDVDGTLYQQRPVRVSMAAELLRFTVARPRDGLRTVRVLKAYRNAQETLRRSDLACFPSTQIDAVSRRLGLSARVVDAIVGEWMFERPLRHVARHRTRGAVDLIDWLASRRILTGVLSDYPSFGKLQALGLGGRFSQVLCTSDAAIGRLKPHPRGFTVACERWDLAPAEVLMVGDRADVDGVGAVAAGMRSVILSSSSRARTRESGITVVSSFEQVRCVIDDRR